MSRFLTTIPSNSGFVNLGTVEAYPTGGTGPTAYGPTSYFGSDPLPAEPGDSIYTPIDLGDFSSVFRSITLNGSHGGLSRKTTTFYKLKIKKSRSIQFTQNFSQFSYTQNTNKNTLIAFYKIEDGNRREELPINNQGYVSPEASIDYNEEELRLEDYPSTRLDPGEYLFLITNDIRFLETNYSISINVSVVDWRFVNEIVDESIDFGTTPATVASVLDFGSI